MPPRKFGRDVVERLKNGLAGWVKIVPVTCEKRSATEFVVTRTLELGPAVGAGLASTCIRTVCPANTLVSEVKSEMAAGEPVTALKPLVSTENVGVAPRVATKTVPADAAVSREFPLTTLLSDRTSEIWFAFTDVTVPSTASNLLANTETLSRRSASRSVMVPSRLRDASMLTVLLAARQVMFCAEQTVGSILKVVLELATAVRLPRVSEWTVTLFPLIVVMTPVKSSIRSNAPVGVPVRGKVAAVSTLA